MQRRKKVLGRYTPEQLEAAVALIHAGASNPEIMTLLGLKSPGALQRIWRAYGFPTRTPDQLRALRQRSGDSRRGQPKAGPVVFEDFTVKAVGFTGPACVACGQPTAPNGYCVNCGVNNARKRVA